MFTKLITGVFAVAALAVGALAFGEKDPADCCAAKLACCAKDKACCAARTKLGCCEKGMKCCTEDRACCAAVQKCCSDGAACCDESQVCCGQPAKTKGAKVGWVEPCEAHRQARAESLTKSCCDGQKCVGPSEGA